VEELLRERGRSYEETGSTGFVALCDARLALAGKDYEETHKQAEVAWRLGATGEAMILAGLAAKGLADEMAATDYFAAGLKSLGASAWHPRPWVYADTDPTFTSFGWAGANEIFQATRVFSSLDGGRRLEFDQEVGVSFANGRYIVTKPNASKLMVWDDWFGTSTTHPAGIPEGCVAASHDGRWLATFDESHLIIIDIRNWTVKAEFPIDGRSTDATRPCLPVFSVDSDELAFQDSQRNISVVTLSTGKIAGKAHIPEACDQLSLGAKTLAVTYQNKLARFARHAGALAPETTLDANKILPLPEGKWGYLSLALSDRGDSWLVQTTMGDMAVIDVPKRRQLWVEGPSDEVGAVAATVGDKQILFRDRQGLRFLEPQHSLIRTIPRRDVLNVAIVSPIAVNGTLWFTDRIGRVWRWANPGSPDAPQVQGPIAGPIAIGFGGLVLSSNSRRVAQLGRSNVRLFDADSGRLLWEKTANGEPRQLFFFGSQSERLGVCSTRGSTLQKPQIWSVVDGSLTTIPIDSDCSKLLARGNSVAVLRGPASKEIAVFSNQGQLRCTATEQGPIAPWHMTADGSLLAFAQSANLVVYETKTCTRFRTLEAAKLGGAIGVFGFEPNDELRFSSAGKLMGWYPSKESTPRILATEENAPGISVAATLDTHRLFASRGGLSLYSQKSRSFLGRLTLRADNPNAPDSRPTIEIWHADGTIAFFGGELPGQTVCAVGPYRFPIDACRAQLQSQRGFDSP
jgi:outer membrane protein assembly factor BamB